MGATPDQSLTHDNIKFLAIARATDQTVLATYCHPSNTTQKNKQKENAQMYLGMLVKVLEAPTWKTQVTAKSRHTLEAEETKFHFMMDDDQLVYVTISSIDYPIRLAFQLLEKVREEVREKVSSKALNCGENGLEKDCHKIFTSLAKDFDDRTKIDKISEVMNQVDGVKNVMQDNIQIVLSNTEKMELMEQKTNDLNEQAKVFRNTGKKLKNSMWWKNFRMMAMISFLLIVMLVIILAMAGVFN